MKVAIITFHWATNYGAVLQTYCLQNYLSELGHEVEIINYKPKQFDFSWVRTIMNPKKWFSLYRIFQNNKKEKLLIEFREKYLKTTQRFYNGLDISEYSSKYDIIISGSDQILNPYFALNGEDGNSSSAYFLGFASLNCKCLGYAVSFGCTNYPDNAVNLVSDWIHKFDHIGVRENTGNNILSQLGYTKDVQLVPDPTVLFGSKLYEDIGIEITAQKKEYICVYMLRGEIRVGGKVKYIDETNKPLTMEEWLYTISSAKGLITNSYHGMIMAILAQVPFVALLETGKASGMNDRFFTLLSRIGLEDRIIYNVEDASRVLKQNIDFNKVNQELSKFRKEGADFLSQALA